MVDLTSVLRNKDTKIPEDGHETVPRWLKKVEELLSHRALQPLEDLQSKLFQRNVSDIEIERGF